MANLAFRPRPIDVNRPLPIVRGELVEDESSAGYVVNRGVPELPSGMEPEEEEEAHISGAIQRRAVNGEEEAHGHRPASTEPEIPVPGCRYVAAYEEEAHPVEFRRPESYLLYIEKTPEELDEQVEYDLDDEDLEFCSRREAVSLGLSAELLEFILDRCEKETGYRDGQLVSLSELEAELRERFPQRFQELRPGVLQAAYSYWRAKREPLVCPLLYRFLRPPAFDDPNPYRAFRPRERQSRQKRQAPVARNDLAALQRMRQLRRDLERARQLLDAVQRRERLKREQLLVLVDLWNARERYLRHTPDLLLLPAPAGPPPDHLLPLADNATAAGVELLPDEQEALERRLGLWSPPPPPPPPRAHSRHPHPSSLDSDEFARPVRRRVLEEDYLAEEDECEDEEHVLLADEDEEGEEEPAAEEDEEDEEEELDDDEEEEAAAHGGRRVRRRERDRARGERARERRLRDRRRAAAASDPFPPLSSPSTSRRRRARIARAPAHPLLPRLLHPDPDAQNVEEDEDEEEEALSEEREETEEAVRRGVGGSARCSWVELGEKRMRVRARMGRGGRVLFDRADPPSPAAAGEGESHDEEDALEAHFAWTGCPLPLDWLRAQLASLPPEPLPAPS